MSDSVKKWHEMQKEEKTSKKTSKKYKTMSKMSEIDQIAQGVADHMKELIEDSVDWQLACFPNNGDDYQEIKEYVINLALNKLLQK